MIWYNPLAGPSSARGDASRRTAAERTASPTVLCFVIFPPVRRCGARQCALIAPLLLRTAAALRFLDSPTAPMAATVCLYDNCQTVNVNATARAPHGSNINGSEERVKKCIREPKSGKSGGRN